MKPRITLSHAWYDSGWRYETWLCEGLGRLGLGDTPREAYDLWWELL